MSNPPAPSLLRRSRALPVALAACLVGLVLCGITYAVAGETVHTRDIDLIDPLPENLVVISEDISCAQLPGGAEEMCRRRLVVRRDGVAAADLADELASFYRDRGFELAAVYGTNGRTYFGPFGRCGPQLFVAGSLTTAMPAGGGVPGRRDRVPTTPVPSETVPTVPTTVADPVPDPAVAPEPTIAPDAAPVDPAAAGFQSDPTDPNVPVETTVPPDGATIDPATGETVVVGGSPSTTVMTPTDDPTDPSYIEPSVDPSTDPLAGIGESDVTIELSEPYPGMC